MAEGITIDRRGGRNYIDCSINWPADNRSREPLSGADLSQNAFHLPAIAHNNVNVGVERGRKWGASLALGAGSGVKTQGRESGNKYQEQIIEMT